MAPITRTLSIVATAGLALVALASSAEAKRHHRHHGHARVVAAPAPALVPAHQRSEYVGLASARLPLIDLGLGPVFPFGGWPK